MAKFGPGDSKVPLGITAFDDELRAIGKNLFYYSPYGAPELYDNFARNGDETLEARGVLVNRTVRFITEGIAEKKWQDPELNRMFVKATALYEEVVKHGRAKPTVLLLKKLVDAFDDPSRFAPARPDPTTDWEPIHLRLHEMAYGGVNGSWTRPREWALLSRAIEDFRFTAKTMKGADKIFADVDRYSKSLGAIKLDEIIQGRNAVLQALRDIRRKFTDAPREQSEEKKQPGENRRR